MLEPQPRGERYTVDDYLSWPEEVRCELIHGVIFAMSPAPVIEHPLPSAKPYLHLANLMNERRGGGGPVCSVLYAPADEVLAEDTLRLTIAPELSITLHEPFDWPLPRAVRQNLQHYG